MADERPNKVGESLTQQSPLAVTPMPWARGLRKRCCSAHPKEVHHMQTLQLAWTLKKELRIS